MTYASGTRRTEELIAAARSLSYSEQYSFTEGWDDNTVVTIMNLGLDRLYDKITQVDNVANIQEVSLNVVAQQQAYDIPIDVHMAVRIMDVRYLYGTQAYEFITLRQGMIQDRFGYPTNIPDVYCIRNGQILLSPVPNLTKNNALIINYQKRMRKLDIRRGKVSSYTADGSNQNFVMTLTFSVLSQKDANLMENANSILDKIDYCTLVDRYGNAIVNAIPLNGYNQTTFALTALPTYTIPASEKAALDAALASGMIVYVVQGDYGSSHSELDRQCEDHLIEYMVLRLLRLQSAAEPTEAQMKTEEAVLDRLRWAYRRVGPSIMPIIFEQRSRPRSWPFGVRGIY
ncbi:MAG TPA: hypothetical protein VFO37_04880 [Chitinophagaceae bacterium]|nr:hypothetical protein [Chitinophagaceae bacterium]